MRTTRQKACGSYPIDYLKTGTDGEPKTLVLTSFRSVDLLEFISVTDKGWREEDKDTEGQTDRRIDRQMLDNM